VCTPIGSRFSIEQTITTLSTRSRTTSSSNSSQPRTDSSTSTCEIGDSANPRSTCRASCSTVSAKPPPWPPRVNAGRTTAGSATPARSSTEVTIRDDHGNVLPTGRAGEICVRGPQVMLGYWQRPEQTKQVLTADGWLHTGDIGAFDSEGFLQLLDRKKDMINVSGFKAFPSEVEDIAMQYPGVREAAAIGVPDPRSGQTVKLFIVRSDPALDKVELTKFMHDRLAGYKVPTIIEFADSLPKSNIGKILRKDLH